MSIDSNLIHTKFFPNCHFPARYSCYNHFTKHEGIIKALKDFNFEIWRMQSQSDVKGLVATLKDSNPANRRAAATAIRALGATTAIPSVQDALLQENDN